MLFPLFLTRLQFTHSLSFLRISFACWQPVSSLLHCCNSCNEHAHYRITAHTENAHLSSEGKLQKQTHRCTRVQRNLSRNKTGLQSSEDESSINSKPFHLWSSEDFSFPLQKPYAPCGSWLTTAPQKVLEMSARSVLVTTIMLTVRWSFRYRTFLRH